MPDNSRNSTLVDVLVDGLKFPEGPAFDTAGNLWYVELEGKTLVRLSNDGQVDRFVVDGAPNGITIDQMGYIWFCDAEWDAIRRFDPQSENIETVVTECAGEPLNRPNDLAFGPAGSLVFTCPGHARTDPTGYVCCLRPDGSVRKVGEDLRYPNGLVFVDGGRTLVVANTYEHRLWRGKWGSETTQWCDYAPWIHVGGPVGPDGLTVDDNGRVHAAVFGSLVEPGKVQIVHPEGRIERTVPVPGEGPTNVAFDPSGERGLVVTEVEHGRLLSFPELGSGPRPYQGGEDGVFG